VAFPPGQSREAGTGDRPGHTPCRGMLPWKSADHGSPERNDFSHLLREPLCDCDAHLYDPTGPPPTVTKGPTAPAGGRAAEGGLRCSRDAQRRASKQTPLVAVETS